MSAIVVVVARPSMIWTLICPVWYLCRPSSSPPWTRLHFPSLVPSQGSCVSIAPFAGLFSPTFHHFFIWLTLILMTHLRNQSLFPGSFPWSQLSGLDAPHWVPTPSFASLSQCYLSNCNFLNLICHHSLTSELLKLGFSFSSSGFLQCLAHNLTINMC